MEKLKQYASLIEDVENEITILSNTSAFLNEVMEDISWVGFYLYDGEALLLGPFQGKVACTHIPLNKGVCGISAYERKTLIVKDVHVFPTHIACDSASNSEIVIPIIVADTLYGVLDIDSTSFNRFDNKDQQFLEALVAILVKQITTSYD